MRVYVARLVCCLQLKPSRSMLERCSSRMFRVKRRILHLTFSRMKLDPFTFKRHYSWACSPAYVSKERGMCSFPSGDQQPMCLEGEGVAVCYECFRMCGCPHPCSCMQRPEAWSSFIALCLIPLRQGLSLDLKLVWQPACPSDPPASANHRAGVSGTWGHFQLEKILFMNKTGQWSVC